MPTTPWCQRFVWPERWPSADFPAGSIETASLVNRRSPSSCRLRLMLAKLGWPGTTARCRVVCQKQLRRNVHMAHAPGGVDSGGQRIADGPCRDRAGRIDAALCHQSRKADPLGVCETPEALGQTILRFSPVRGITSATVPRQSKSQYSAQQRRRDRRAMRGGQLERHADARHLREPAPAGPSGAGRRLRPPPADLTYTRGGR